MADFHTFGKLDRNFLFFARSARLYELDPEAARTLAALSDSEASLTGSTELDAGPAPGRGLI